MATLITLLDVETEVESVYAAFFAAAPYSLSTKTSDTATDILTPRLEVVAEVIKWGPHQFTPASGTFSGVAIYDQFLIRTQLALVYQPEQAQSPGTMRGTLRTALCNWTGIKTAFAVHNYLIPTGDSMRQVGGSRTINDADKTETITSELEMILFLNPAAMTAAT